MSIDGSMSVGQKFSYRYVQKYRDICFRNAPGMQFLGVQKLCSADIFSDTTQKHVFCKICKAFWAKPYCNRVIFFASFCWLWDFLLENLKVKKNSDDVHWNVWTIIKKLYVRNNIFKKSNFKYYILNHLYFRPNFPCLVDCFRAF